MRAGPLVAQLAAAAMVLAVDLLTKTLAVSLIPADHAITVLGDNVRLVVERNAGAALSIGQDRTWVFTGIVVAVMGVLSWCSRGSDSRFVAAGIGLVLGGALGNLGDRLFRAPAPLQGHVVQLASGRTSPSTTGIAACASAPGPTTHAAARANGLRGNDSH